jgi:hypothetical protein
LNIKPVGASRNQLALTGEEPPMRQRLVGQLIKKLINRSKEKMQRSLKSHHWNILAQQLLIN